MNKCEDCKREMDDHVSPNCKTICVYCEDELNKKVVENGN